MAIDLRQLCAYEGSRLRPGDIVRLGVADSSFAVYIKISTDSVVPPAPATYHLIVTDQKFKNATTALSASGPAPQLIEAPAEDLARGFVRRRGLFFWYFTLESRFRSESRASLVKLEHSGAGQLPNAKDDFLPFL